MEGFYGKPGSKAMPCPAKFYCQAATEQPVPCPFGTISVPQSTDVSNCLSGPGFYGYPGKPATICPEDTFCPVGAYQPQQCPEGFMANIGSAKLDDCVVLPSGICLPLAPTRPSLHTGCSSSSLIPAAVFTKISGQQPICAV
jgi:hypothetical protein